MLILCLGLGGCSKPVPAKHYQVVKGDGFMLKLDTTTGETWRMETYLLEGTFTASAWVPMRTYEGLKEHVQLREALRNYAWCMDNPEGSRSAATPMSKEKRDDLLKESNEIIRAIFRGEKVAD